MRWLPLASHRPGPLGRTLLLRLRRWRQRRHWGHQVDAALRAEAACLPLPTTPDEQMARARVWEATRLVALETLLRLEQDGAWRSSRP